MESLEIDIKEYKCPKYQSPAKYKKNYRLTLPS